MEHILTRPRQFRLLALLAAAALAAGLLALVAVVDPAEAAFPGQNGKIAFTSVRDGNPEIYTMNADGSNQTNISNDAATDEAPAWSLDGSKVVFTRFQDNNNEIYTMNADGSNQARLTFTATHEIEPVWSPDGSKIASVVVPPEGGTHMEIYTMNSDGSNQTNITNSVAQERHPAWSPDGTKIAFTYQDGSRTDIYTMNPDGSDRTNLTNSASSGGNTDFPDWSPDGTKIAFIGGNTVSSSGIYVMNADGSDQTLIRPLEHPSHPNWSPDGSKIAFDHWDGDSVVIYTMNADGSNQTNISNNAASDYYPAWQPLPDTAPTITSVRPAPGSTTTDRTPTIMATVSDQQTNLAKTNITLTFDGQTIPRTAFAYNRSTDKLTYTPDKKLALGKHNVRVIAKDEANLSTTKNWDFEIVHP
jgi:dipeptidyl aminopeptidase/acylaminoacyl peptidase